MKSIYNHKHRHKDTLAHGSETCCHEFDSEIGIELVLVIIIQVPHSVLVWIETEAASCTAKYRPHALAYIWAIC